MNILERTQSNNTMSRPILPNETINFIGDLPVYYSQDISIDNYQSLGFKNREEAEYWRENGCGIPCAQMVIRNLKGEDTSFVKLVQRGLELNAYKEPLGWIHKGLARMIEEYGIDAKCVHLETIEDIARNVKSGGVLILSVTAGFKGGKRVIEDGEEKVKEKGGHLVFIYGYKINNKSRVDSLLLHDPDYWPEFQKINTWVERDEIIKSWTGNTIICKR